MCAISFIDRPYESIQHLEWVTYSDKYCMVRQWALRNVNDHTKYIRTQQCSSLGLYFDPFDANKRLVIDRLVGYRLLDFVPYQAGIPEGWLINNNSYPIKTLILDKSMEYGYVSIGEGNNQYILKFRYDISKSMAELLDKNNIVWQTNITVSYPYALYYYWIQGSSYLWNGLHARYAVRVNKNSGAIEKVSGIEIDSNFYEVKLSRISSYYVLWDGNHQYDEYSINAKTYTHSILLQYYYTLPLFARRYNDRYIIGSNPMYYMNFFHLDIYKYDGSWSMIDSTPAYVLCFDIPNTSSANSARWCISSIQYDYYPQIVLFGKYIIIAARDDKTYITISTFTRQQITDGSPVHVAPGHLLFIDAYSGNVDRDLDLSAYGDYVLVFSQTNYGQEYMDESELYVYILNGYSSGAGIIKLAAINLDTFAIRTKSFGSEIDNFSSYYPCGYVISGS